VLVEGVGERVPPLGVAMVDGSYVDGRAARGRPIELQRVVKSGPRKMRSGRRQDLCRTKQ
jgi:hypothetical protein